ncbi:MAG TPA: thioredoxin [Myxococcota bacterium]
MSTVHASKESFNELVDKIGIVIVDFWAEWCGPCKRFGPIFESASDKHKDVVFAKVDTEEQPELAGGFGIRSIPTLMVFRDQVLIFAQAGALPAEALEEVIAQVKALDMVEVKKKIAEAEAQESPAT